MTCSLSLRSSSDVTLSNFGTNDMYSVIELKYNWPLKKYNIKCTGILYVQNFMLKV